MKYLVIISFLIIFGWINAQSKKKQIEILNKRVDSLNEIVGSERKINLDKSNKISELTQTITNLESSISSLKSDVIKLTSELQSRELEITNLKTHIKIKSDSLSLLTSELKKLKPAPKLLVTNNTTNQDTQTGLIKSIKIGTQTWMTENLNVSTFQNGDTIPEAKTEDEWIKFIRNKQPAWCYYDNDPKNGKKYGKLYNWYAVNDLRELAPNGWHVPNDQEWITLKNELGTDAAKKMKNTSGWDSWNSGGEKIICSNCKNWNTEYRRKTACHSCQDSRDSGKKTPIIKNSGNGTNSAGFSALPGGWRNGFKDFWYTEAWQFDHLGVNCYWWSSTIPKKDGKYFKDGYYHGHCILNNKNNEILTYIQDDDDDRLFLGRGGIGMYVRCIKD